MNPIIKRIRDRLHRKDQNYLAIVCGGTGSGKSESSIQLAKLIDDHFDHNQIVFSVEDFYKLLNSGTLEQGNCIVWEEMGVSTDSRTFYSLQNRAVVYTLETFRALNLSIIFNVPGLGMIDSNVRKLCHQYFETQSINRKEKLCTCKIMDMQYNPRIDKIYFKYPRVMVNDEIVTVERIRFRKPPDKIIDQYKKDKQEFIDNLNLNMEKAIKEKKADKERGKIKDIRPIVSKILKQKDNYVYIYQNKWKIKAEVIANEFKVGMPTANRVKASVESTLAKEYPN
jgi:hypothetical protein